MSGTSERPIELSVGGGPAVGGVDAEADDVGGVDDMKGANPLGSDGELASGLGGGRGGGTALADAGGESSHGAAGLLGIGLGAGLDTTLSVDERALTTSCGKLVERWCAWRCADATAGCPIPGLCRPSGADGDRGPNVADGEGLDEGNEEPGLGDRGLRPRRFVRKERGPRADCAYTNVS